MKSPKKRSGYRLNIGRIPVYAFLIVWTVTELLALIWMTYSSFKSTPEFYRDIWSLPSSLNFSGYYTDITGTGNPVVPLGQYLTSSAIVAFTSVAGIILISVPAGYTLSKKSRGNSLLFYFFLAMIAIPAPALLIPEFFFIKYLGIFNNYVGVILPYVSFNIPFSIVLARAFFRSFPKELEEAGKIDGLSDLGIFLRIVLPLSTIIVVVLAIVNFPNVWNELLYALVILPANDAKTVQPGLLLFQSTFLIEWQKIFAGLVLTSLPMIVFYIVFQRYIVKAVFLGAIKG